MRTYSMNLRGNKMSSTPLTSTQRTLTTVLTVLALLLFITDSSVQAAAVHHKRSVTGENSHVSPASPNDGGNCQFDSACGWEVYDRRSRHTQYYVQGSCICVTGTTCVLVWDDLPISAYVYNCRVVPVRKSKGKSKSTIGRLHGSSPTTTS